MLSFSIITCAWNSEPFIAQCIDSVSSQTYRQVEQVFVDGGSTDGTLDRIRSVGGSSQWVTDVRGGISAAMNVGAKLAQGDYIAHLHGDDYFRHADVLENVSQRLQETGADWLFARIVSDIDGNQVYPDWKMPPYSRSRLLSRNFIAHPAVFIRRELFMKLGGFDTSLRYAMDYDLWLRASEVRAPVYLDEFVTAFRRHAGSASTANALVAFEEDHEVRKRYISSSTSVGYHNAVHVWRRFRHFGKIGLL